ncbi:MAG TPA: gamma carbonic anhydrase family protein [Acidimicrobiales bacterium]|jgi:phenylacetic acid degradation protein|nr:gamma carbonic anhydrase family protein [Acidimicrobiales bacterium]
MGIYEIDGVVPVVHPEAFVHPEAVLIGDVIVGAGSYIGPCASLRGDFGRIVVGEGANVQDSCVMHCYPGADCVVEDSGHIGHGAVLHGCTVGTGAMVGIGSVLLDGVVVGARSLVGAHSFVRAGFEVPAETLVAGSPAKVIRPLDETDLAWKANGVKVYQELARRSLATLRPVEPLREAEADRARVSTGRDVATPPHVLRGR